MTFALLTLCVITGCTPMPSVIINDPPPGEKPIAVNLPVEMRQTNWADARGSGSCVIASSISMLRWQNNLDAADFMRRTFAGGQTASSIRQKIDSMGLDYVYTESADPNFLNWATETRRGAIIWFYPSHCVTFCGFWKTESGTVALLLDNNRTRDFIAVPAREFLDRWRGYDGFALTILGPPVPPPFYEKWTTDDENTNLATPRSPNDRRLPFLRS